MPRRLDPNTSESLLAGTLHPEDAPPGYARLASLLGEAAHARAIRDRGTAPLADGEALGVVAAMHETLATGGPRATQPHTSEQPFQSHPRVPTRRATRLAGVPAAVAGVGLLLMATAGAAVVVAATAPPGRPVAASHAAGQHVSQAGVTHGKVAGREASGATDAGNHPSSGAHPGRSEAMGAKHSAPSSHATFGLCMAEAAGAGTHRSPHAPALPSAATCAATHHPGNGYGRPNWSLPPGGSAYLPPSNAPAPHPGGPGGAGNGEPGHGVPPMSPGRPSAGTPAGTSDS